MEWLEVVEKKQTVAENASTRCARREYVDLDSPGGSVLLVAD